jgi:hypothetical protein
MQKKRRAKKSFNSVKNAKASRIDVDPLINRFKGMKYIKAIEYFLKKEAAQWLFHVLKKS